MAPTGHIFHGNQNLLLAEKRQIHRGPRGPYLAFRLCHFSVLVTHLNVFHGLEESRTQLSDFHFHLSGKS